MPLLEVLDEAVESVPCTTEQEQIVTPKQVSDTEEKASVEADIIKAWKLAISVDNLRGQLRKRFCLPGNFEMEVLRQGIIVPIPDLGVHKNSAEAGVWFCFGDNGEMEVAEMSRSTGGQPWTLKERHHFLSSEENIPEFLENMMQKVNWSMSQGVQGLRVLPA